MSRPVLLVLTCLCTLTLLLTVACGEEPAAQPSEPSGASAQAAPASAPAAVSSGSAPAAPSNQASTSQPASPPAASSAPSPAPASPPAAQPGEMLSVVTTSNIVGDWVKTVGQDRVDVFSLLPPDTDIHTYQPGAQDVAKVADADVVMTVGLELEGDWLHELVENAARDEESVIALGESVDPIDFVEIFDDHGDHMEEHDDHMEEGVELLGRLLVGDGETGSVSVIDLEHGDVEQNEFDLGSRAGRIYATRSGRFAIAVSSDANTAHVIDGGVFLEAHGDHFDLVEGPTQVLDMNLAGDRPVHLYVGEEWATIFYDGSGDVVFINEHELEEEGSSYVPPRMNVGPQHGAAVPLEGDLFALSTPHPDYASDPVAYRRPIGAHIRDLSGAVLYRAENGCPDLHGDAGNGHMAVFGCTGGVLVVEAHDGEFHDDFIAAPAGSPEDFRLGTVWGGHGSDHFYALGSEVGLYIVEPEEGVMEQVVPVTGDLRPIQVGYNVAEESLIVVMSDGEIRMYDAHDGDIVATNSDALHTPVETGFWARPHVAFAPGAIFVTDSVGGHVLQLDDHDLEVVDSWDVAGTPVKIAFVGVLGETEGHEEHGHEEEGHEEEGHMEHGHDEHGHAHGEHDPHFWFDPTRVQQAVNSIAAHLSGADPANQTFYRENAAAYNRELEELDAWIQQEVAKVPEDHRLLVTSHDAFQYFAVRYGFEVVGAILPFSTEADPSAKELAELVEIIEHEGAPAVFAERSHSDRLARRIAEETGATLVGGLYTGSLGVPGGEADTYIDYMRFNVITIVEALG